MCRRPGWVICGVERSSAHAARVQEPVNGSTSWREEGMFAGALMNLPAHIFYRGARGRMETSCKTSLAK